MPRKRTATRYDYTVVYEQDDGTWGASIPDLPGCVAAGASKDEVRELIREAIVLHLESLLAYGDPLPPPGAWTKVIGVRADELHPESLVVDAAAAPATRPT
jgi:predicted RNase H-like HicB family nuclease